MIGIIGPAEEEIIDFIKDMDVEKTEKYAMLDFHIGKYKNTPCIALFCGVGKVNASIAAQILITKYRVDYIILSGVAGGLATNLKVGDIVIATEIAHHDVEEEILTEYHPYVPNKFFKTDQMAIKFLKENFRTPWIHYGKLVTGEYFVTHETREKIINKFSPLCVDMESAAIAQVCYVNKVPFTVIRSISDFADENSIKSFENNIEKTAIKATDITKKLVEKINDILI